MTTYLLLLGTVTVAQAQQRPAAQRLMEAVRVASSADSTRMTSFVAATYAPTFRTIAPDEVHVRYLSQLAGYTVDPAAIAGDARRATAGVANPHTEEIDSITVEVDGTPANQITRIGFRSGVGGATVPERVFHNDAQRAAELRRYVSKLAAADKFSGVVLFAKQGNVLLHEAYGTANKDFNVPNRPDTKFNLGSANKNFTAIVIGQLVQEGKLSWDDPLSKFIADFPDSASARKIQIKHLLSHTAGLGSYFNRRFLESSRARFRTVDEMMTLARPDTMRFEPGTRFRYSNTGYLVLGKVIEVVERRSYFDVVRDRIFRPLGMTSTDAYDLDRVNPNLAVGYTPISGTREFRNNIFEHVIRGGPAGGGYSNAPDLLKYAEALRTGKLITGSTLELMRSPKRELQAARYGYGFALFDAPDIWGHGGDFPGIDFDLHQFGDSGYTIILLANYDRVNDPILRKVIRMMRGSGAIAANN
jgi:CubicO group peptidase (beta-lactamase class C family)